MPIGAQTGAVPGPGLCSLRREGTLPISYLCLTLASRVSGDGLAGAATADTPRRHPAALHTTSPLFPTNPMVRVCPGRHAPNSQIQLRSSDVTPQHADTAKILNLHAAHASEAPVFAAGGGAVLRR